MAQSLQRSVFRGEDLFLGCGICGTMHGNIDFIERSLSLLSVSIVVYRSDRDVLSRCMKCLDLAVDTLREHGQEMRSIAVSLIDNAAPESARVDVAAASLFDGGSELRSLDVQVLAGHGNIGYGRGHNLAIVDADSRYHLILNPDVDLAHDALVEALAFMESHPDVLALAPRITGADGALQYLCRRYPTLLDLFVRGFIPKGWQKYFHARLARYELRAEIDRAEAGSARDKTHAQADSLDLLHPVIISGCFMLFRTPQLQSLGGFDPRYFLYFEDYDLSLRAAAIGKLAYVPSVRIVHYGGNASRKGWTHVKLFLISAGRFFNRFGWRIT